jgi:predicted nucleotidyltransferase
MPVTQEQLEKAVNKIIEEGATRVVLFGSAADSLEEARDLDLACEGIDWWEMLGLQAQLEEELRIPIDLVPLKPETRFTRHVERWGRVVYEA